MDKRILSLKELIKVRGTKKVCSKCRNDFGEKRYGLLYCNFCGHYWKESRRIK